MRAGKLRHRVALQASTRTITTDGYTDAWATYANEFVSIEPATPRSTATFVQATITTPITHVVRLRYRSDLLAKHRILHNARALYIAGMQNVEERNKEWILACEEKAA
jgi:SPP1 family predicted phage head-tail adaptor